MECKKETIWEKWSENPVLGGDLGVCFDLCMLKENGLFKMYFSWRSRSLIAMTTSKDGVHWAAPIECIAPRKTARGWEDDVNRPSVIKVGETYHMWYTGQYNPAPGIGTSHIFHAVSEDGIRFTRTADEPVLSPVEPWEKVAVMCPCVLYDRQEQFFRMWYSGGEQYEPNAIGYAESRDGMHWDKKFKDPVFQADPASPWECHKVTACQVFPYRDQYWMFYIGFATEDLAQIGMARSKDGMTGWERSLHNPILSPEPGGFDADACYKPFVLKDNDRWLLWYNGRNGSCEQIGMAVFEKEDLVF